MERSQLKVYLRQTAALTTANLKSRYRKTVSGMLWVVMNPIIMYGVQSLVFKKFLKLNVPDYARFLLSGLLPWIFISQSLEMCTSILVTSSQLLKSYPVPPLVYIAAQLLDNVINFLVAFTLLLIPVSIQEPAALPGIMLLPIPLTILVVGVLGLGWLLATLQVFMRDTRFLVTFVLSVAFFLTPVFYPIDLVPEHLRILVHINPFHRLIEPFRHSLYDFDPRTFVHTTLIAAAVSLSFVTLAVTFWTKKRNAVYLNL